MAVITGQVVKEYCGTGPLAELQADENADARAERCSRLETERAEREGLSDADAALDAFDAETNAATQQVLTAAGYQQHKRGEWRRVRGQK